MIRNKYHHLTCNRRYQLAELLSIGCKQKGIAKRLGIDSATVSRERAGNSDQNGKYNYLEANIKSKERRKKASGIPRKLKGTLEKQVKECLIKYWSPDQISRMLKNEGIQISHTSIYNYVHKNKDSNGLSFLRHGGRKYKTKIAVSAGVNFIPDRVDISERPEVVAEKSRIGDWEGDSIISHGSHCVILTLVDRKSKFLIAKKVGKKTKENMNAAILKSSKIRLYIQLLLITAPSSPDTKNSQKS